MKNAYLILIGIAIGLILISIYAIDMQQFTAMGNNGLTGEKIGQFLLAYRNGSSTVVNAYLATNTSQQEQGLMNQSSMGNCNGLGNCYGMFFVFHNYSRTCFWMKNTIMPLKQFWITNNVITAEYTGTPYSTYIYCNYSDSVLETAINSTLQVGEGVTLQRQ